MELMQETFKTYQILNQIGTKASYLAHPLDQPEQIVVLKLLDVEYHGDEDKTFRQKADVIKDLKHPHIVPILDIGIEQKQLYVVSEYKPRGSLRNFLDSVFPQQLDSQKALGILSQIGDALSYVHGMGIIHSNLKLENIVFDVEGNAFLTDFNLSGLVHTTKLDYNDIRSVIYMAPEAFSGKTDQISDQYSFACIAYALITGHAPFIADDFPTLWLKHTRDLPRPLSETIPDLPKKIEDAVHKALQKDPAKRHADIMAFLECFKPFVQSGNPIITTSTSSQLPSLADKSEKLPIRIQEKVDKPSHATATFRLGLEPLPLPELDVIESDRDASIPTLNIAKSDQEASVRTEYLEFSPLPQSEFVIAQDDFLDPVFLLQMKQDEIASFASTTENEEAVPAAQKESATTKASSVALADVVEQADTEVEPAQSPSTIDEKQASPLSLDHVDSSLAESAKLSSSDNSGLPAIEPKLPKNNKSSTSAQTWILPPAQPAIISQVGTQDTQSASANTGNTSKSSGPIKLARNAKSQPKQPRGPKRPVGRPSQRDKGLFILLGAALLLALLSAIRPYEALLNLYTTPSSPTHGLVTHQGITPTATPVLPRTTLTTPSPSATTTPKASVTTTATVTATATATATSIASAASTPTPTPTSASALAAKATPTPTPTPTLTPTPAAQTSMTVSYQEYNLLTDLTNVGKLDWRQWGMSAATDVNYKKGVQSQISNYTLIGSGTVKSDHVDPIDFTWSDGTPHASVSAVTACIYVQGVNNGFSITVPASTTPRTLKLYVGVYRAKGLLTASLNGVTKTDSSLDMRTDPANSSDNAVYTITYSTTAPNQQLTISYTAAATNGTGATFLEAAALQ